jgi:hypothetical protein
MTSQQPHGVMTSLTRFARSHPSDEKNKISQSFWITCQIARKLERGGKDEVYGRLHRQSTTQIAEHAGEAVAGVEKWKVEIGKKIVI